MTTYKEWAAAGGRLRLAGGPHDGKDLDAGLYEAWPIYIRMVNPATGLVSSYRMRVGDLEWYDFVGSFDGPRAPSAPEEP